MPEWLYPADSVKKDAMFANNQLLKVCRHLADGSKHFTSRHTSVKDTSLKGSAFQPGAFQSDAFQVGRLVVELELTPATQLGPEIEAIALAERILKFWNSP